MNFRYTIEKAVEDNNDHRYILMRCFYRKNVLISEPWDTVRLYPK